MLLKRLFALVLAGLFGAAGYAIYQGQARQAATLQRLAALDSCLAASNQQRAQAAAATVRTIVAFVRANRNQPRDLVVLRKTQQVQLTTNALTDTLRQLRQSWPASAARVQQLAAQMKHYEDFIRLYKPGIPPLTQPTASTSAVGWLGEFDLATQPKPAAQALLTKLETQVQQIATNALQPQALKIACGNVIFDKIGAFAAPVAHTVAPGAPYRAQLMLSAASSSDDSIYFSADGRRLPVAPASNQGVVQFIIPALRPGQPDTVRAQWHGRIRLAQHPADTVLETTVPYFIVKPTSQP